MADGIDLFSPFWSVILTSMARLPLHTLPAFRTVAELQNLRAAADVLHLTHSAVSQQIRGLEEQLRGRGARVLRFAKPTFTKVAPIDLRHEIAEQCDVVIEALAD